MKRVLTAVGMGMASVALLAGPAVAQDNPYPASEGWEKVDYTFTAPKNTYCNVAVKVRIVGYDRVTKLNKSGTKTLSESADETATLTNQKTGKKIKRDISGSFTDTTKGTTLRGVGRGNNVYAGKGIRGIILAKGTQRYIETNINDPKKSTLDIYKTRGTTTELCRVLGARPVNGKNLG